MGSKNYNIVSNTNGNVPTQFAHFTVPLPQDGLMNPAHSQTLATASFTNSLHDNNSLSSAIFLTRAITHNLFIYYLL